MVHGRILLRGLVGAVSVGCVRERVGIPNDAASDATIYKRKDCVNSRGAFSIPFFLDILLRMKKTKFGLSGLFLFRNAQLQAFANHQQSCCDLDFKQANEVARAGRRTVEVLH
jgi:hypothetical protein